MIKFTVITPTIGRTTLIDTINSIQSQDYPSEFRQHLIVYDGPEDAKFHQLVEKYQNSDLNIKVIATGQNFGDYGHGVRKWAADKANGDYTLYLDDDDKYIGEVFSKINKLVEALKIKPTFIFFNCLRQGQSFLNLPPGYCRTVSCQYAHLKNDSEGNLIQFKTGSYTADSEWVEEMVAKYDYYPLVTEPLVQVDLISRGEYF